MPHEVSIPGVQVGVEQRQRELTYASLPFQTHPIDIAYGSQGWGPFQGPWTPWDFESAKDVMTGGFGLDITWLAGDNAPTYAPSYAVLSLMQDRSLDLVNNAGMVAIVQQGNGREGASTFAQSDSVQLSGVGQGHAGSSGFWATLRNLFTTQQGG